MSVPAAPTLLISWSHSEPDWEDLERERLEVERRDAVLRLSATLRGLGIDADLDLHQPGGTADWTRWGPQKVAELDYVLIVVSPAWSRAWEGSGDPKKGPGAAAEADTLKSLYNRDRRTFRSKVRLIFLPGTPQTVPLGLDGVERYVLTQITAGALTGLVRDLSDQPLYPKGPLGPLPALPPSTSWRDDQSSVTGLEGRLQAELSIYPVPSSEDGSTTPWVAERRATAKRLAALRKVSGNKNAGELQYRPLEAAVSAQWRDSWSRRETSTETLLTVHVLPWPLMPMSARQLAGVSTGDILSRIRSTGLFDNRDAIEVREDISSITFTVTEDRRYLRQVRPGKLRGLRIDLSGQISAWHSLPADSLGSALDRRSAAGAIKDCLLLVGSVGILRCTEVALAAELGPVTLLSLVDVETLGVRTSARISAFASPQLHLPPDELVEIGALGTGSEEAAQGLAALLVRVWGLTR